MSGVITLVPCTYIPSNLWLNSVVADINAEILSAAVTQAASTTTATTTANVAATVSASASTTVAAETAVTAGTTTSVAGTSAVSATTAAISSVAVPIAVSMMAILAAGMVIDVAKAQRELRRCHKLTIETVFSSKNQLVNALFAYSKEDACKIYEEADGSLIVRYHLQDYFFRMDQKRGCYNLEIVNAQHPLEELEKINRIQLCYMDAVRRRSYESLMKTVAEQGWTVEQDVTESDGSRCVSILI